MAEDGRKGIATKEHSAASRNQKRIIRQSRAKSETRNPKTEGKPNPEIRGSHGIATKGHKDHKKEQKSEDRRKVCRNCATLLDSTARDDLEDFCFPFPLHCVDVRLSTMNAVCSSSCRAAPLHPYRWLPELRGSVSSSPFTITGSLAYFSTARCAAARTSAGDSLHARSTSNSASDARAHSSGESGDGRAVASRS